MITAITIIHAIISILLIGTVLLQFGKGAEAGLMMDAGASSILPQKGNVMTKITTVLAIFFLGLALTLSIMRSHQASESIFDKTTPAAGPLGVQDAPVPAPAKESQGVEATSPEAPKTETDGAGKTTN